MLRVIKRHCYGFLMSVTDITLFCIYREIYTGYMVEDLSRINDTYWKRSLFFLCQFCVNISLATHICFVICIYPLHIGNILSDYSQPIASYFVQHFKVVTNFMHRSEYMIPVCAVAFTRIGQTFE